MDRAVESGNSGTVVGLDVSKSRGPRAGKLGKSNWFDRFCSKFRLGRIDSKWKQRSAPQPIVLPL